MQTLSLATHDLILLGLKIFGGEKAKVVTEGHFLYLPKASKGIAPAAHPYSCAQRAHIV